MYFRLEFVNLLSKILYQKNVASETVEEMVLRVLYVTFKATYAFLFRTKFQVSNIILEDLGVDLQSEESRRIIIAIKQIKKDNDLVLYQTFSNL